MKNLILFTLFFTSITGWAQMPEWVSKDFRNSNYPERSFLTGYVEINDINKKYIDEEMQQVVDAAKSQLTQSVRVQVKSVSTSNVTDFNGQVDDYFNQKTTASSDLQLIGLQTDSYYDKKSKKGYGFAYVNKNRMVEYYRSEIGKQVSEITNIIDLSKGLQTQGDLKKAYKKGLEAFNKFFVIDESQKILMAIGANTSLDTRVDQVSELNASYSELMNGLVTDRRMTLDDAGFIMATGLLKSQGDQHKDIGLHEFTYEQTGFGSDFSSKLNEVLKQSLPSEAEVVGYSIQGVYLKEGSNLVLKGKLVDASSQKVIGRNMVQITQGELMMNNVSMVPADIQNLEQLVNMQFVSQTTGAKGKAGLGLDKDLVALVTVNGNPAGGIPVKFFNNNGETVYCSTISDVHGLASCKVKKISGAYKNQVLKASIDMAKYVSNDSSKYVTDYLRNKTLPESSFKVQVMPSTIYVKSEENNFGESLDVKLIEPKLKQSLSGEGFDFDEVGDHSDYIISIRAASRKGGYVGGVYFAYVDVSISVYDNNQGREIYKESINNVKGGGGTFEQAGGKAYYKASDMAQKQIEDLLVD